MSGSGVVRQHTFCWMIANADREGCVEVNPRLLAAMFGPPATPDAVTEALSWLAMTDPLSRTKERDGQRIEHVDAFLWRIINYTSYRDLVKAEEIKEQTRERVRRFRERNANSEDSNAPVTGGNGKVTPVRGQRSDDTKSKPSEHLAMLDAGFFTAWQAVPLKKGKGDALKHFTAYAKKHGVDSATERFTAGVANYLATPKTFDGQAWMHGSTLFCQIAKGDWSEVIQPDSAAALKSAKQKFNTRTIDRVTTGETR